MSNIIPSERIENKILLVRGKKVMLDRDLAELYGVPAKAFNQAVKRNSRRFPSNFIFRLTLEEADSLRSQTVTIDKGGAVSKRGKHSKYLPYAFTEHGALMSATILNSERAIDVSVMVIEAFVRMRDLLETNVKFASKLKEIEERLDMNDQNVVTIMHALRDHLRQAPPPVKKKIGFHTD